MPLKQFLQNLFERVGLAEAPLPPPHAADVSLAEAAQLRPVFLRLAAWGTKQVTIVAGDAPDADDLLAAARQAAAAGMHVSVRGRASDMAAGTLLADLAAAKVRTLEIPILAAVAEVHNALGGMGDYRAVLKTLDACASLALTLVPQVVLTPSIWKTIERTRDMLCDRGLSLVRLWPIVCRDDEPSSWALSAGELTAAAKSIEAWPKSKLQFGWHPPQKFDPARALAQQVRRGPRAASDSVRIEPDGSVVASVGPAVAGGNISQNDWKLIARSEIFRAWKRRRDAAERCERCPGLAACAGGCLRDEGNWAED